MLPGRVGLWDDSPRVGGICTLDFCAALLVSSPWPNFSQPSSAVQQVIPEPGNVLRVLGQCVVQLVYVAPQALPGPQLLRRQTVQVGGQQAQPLTCSFHLGHPLVKVTHCMLEFLGCVPAAAQPSGHTGHASLKSFQLPSEVQDLPVASLEPGALAADLFLDGVDLSFYSSFSFIQGCVGGQEGIRVLADRVTEACE